MVSDLDHRIAALAARQHGIFTCGQALAQGATRKQIADRIKAGRWAADAPGLYVVAGSPRTWRQRVLAAVLASGGGAAASHCTAAALWGLPGFSEDVVELSRLEGRSYRSSLARVRRTGLLPEHHILECDGIRTTTPARTIFDLAGAVHAKRAERGLDNALARKVLSLERLRSTHRELAEHGRAGSCSSASCWRRAGSAMWLPSQAWKHSSSTSRGNAACPSPPARSGSETTRNSSGVSTSATASDGSSSRSTATGTIGRSSTERATSGGMSSSASGWRVVRITEDVVRDRPTDGLELIERLLAEAA